MSNGRISFSLTSEDLASNTFEPAPEGWYDVTIDDVQEQEVKKEGPNKGKPMYVVEFKSLDDSFKGKQRTYACLWYEARFAIVDIMKATGFKVEAGTLEIPESDEFVSKELQIRLTIEDYINNDGEKARRNQVKQYRPIGAGKTGAVAKSKRTPAAKGAKAGGFSL